MHNQKEENPITRPRETERLNGELEIDYQRNTVKFHPNALPDGLLRRAGGFSNSKSRCARS
jgi:hypothetical protein